MKKLFLTLLLLLPVQVFAFYPDTGGTLTTGLVAYWNLDANSNDSTAGGHNGSDTTITYSAGNGKVGNGAGFNGSSSFISVPDHADWTMTTGGSYCAWINPTSNGREIVSHFDPSSPFAGMTFTDGGDVANKISLYVHSGTTGGWADDTGTNISTATWTFVCATFDTSNVRFYQNGSLTSTIPNGGYAGNSTSIFAIGRDSNTTPGRYWNGALDEIGVWSKKLTSTEITDLYNSGNGNTYSASAPASGVTPDDGFIFFMFAPIPDKFVV